MVGLASGEILTYQGAVIYHDNPAELEYLVPNVRVIPWPPLAAAGRLRMSIKRHPDLSHVCWPLDPADFVRSAR